LAYHTVPEQFTRDDPSNLGPWLSVNQTLAWVATRIGSFTEFVGYLETRDEDEHGAVYAHAIAENMSSLSDEGAQFLDECEAQETWPGGSIFAHSGRALLRHILVGKIAPSAFEKGVGRIMQQHEFAGLGRGQSAVDWLAVRPSPMFAVEEIFGAFPKLAKDTADAVGSPTVKAERDCRDWLIQQFAMDPLKRRSKKDFQAAAELSFARLSKRGFTRVWDSLSEKYGRNQPGSKGKSSQ
jgi:hypothetical protein